MSRDLYRSVLRGSPCEAARDLSPMSNLAYTLHNASLAIATPRRKLSLSSNMSDTPQSCHNLSTSSQLSPGLMQDSTSSESPGGSCCEDALLSPTRRMAPSRNKENFPSPYYSPSRTHSSIPSRSRASPLQEVQNTVNRNLNFNSPLKKNLQMVSPSKRSLTSPQKPSPPDDFDTNSQDSGYSESGKKIDDDCFSVPISCAPRRLNLDSPPKPKLQDSPMNTSTSPRPSISTTSGLEGRTPFRKFSLPKADEEDAMFMDLMQEDNGQDEPVTGFTNLLSAPIQSTSVTLTTTQAPTTAPARPCIRRCLSMVDTTPTTSRVQSVCKAADAVPTITSFKRPEPPLDTTNQDCKRRKMEERPADSSPISSSAPTTTANKQTSPLSALTQRQISAPESSSSQVTRPKLQRCHSESHVSIMKALNKSSGQVDLIGDFSKPLLLPTIEGGKHPDLKSISVETMAGILRGEYKKQIASCRIVDCRYPYEFEGGHIMSAEMWHHPEMVAENLECKVGAPVVKSTEAPRDIIIFHCEFSAERGPKAQRLLREMDRKANKEHYPALHFPEMYLLEGGYKAFYEKYPNLCTPASYVRMLDENHTKDFKHFRGKSKSWAAENKQSKNRAAGQPRPGLKRLGL